MGSLFNFIKGKSMRYQKRIYLFCILLSLALYCLPTDYASGARVAGDNQVTPSAPEPDPAAAVPAPEGTPDENFNGTNNPSSINPAPGEMTTHPGIDAPAENTGNAENPVPGVASDNVASKGNISKNSIDQNSKKPKQKTPGGKTDAATTGKPNGGYAFDFDNADLAPFIKFISQLTGKNFIVDSNVKGKVTIMSPKEITKEEAYKVFESVLEVNGYTTVPSENAIKIVPMVEARSKNIETKTGQDSSSPDDRLVTQLIPLKFASPEEMKTVLAPFISKNSIMVSYAPTGTLIITDVLSNIKRLQEIIEKIDIEGTGEIISVIPLEYAGAETMAKSLTSVFKTTAPKSAKDTSSSIVIVADTRTNSVLLLASEVDTLKIKELIKLLDKESPKGEGDIHVYYLQNAKAEDLAKVLTSLPTGNNTASSTAAATGAAPKQTSVALSKDIQILADKATNSLIINAGKDDYMVLEDIIRKLDITRKMVYIEALIMEVSMTKKFQLGVQWYGGKTGSINGKDVLSFGSSSATSGAMSMPSLTTTGGVSLPSGLNLGVLGDTITIGDFTFPSIAAVIQAYGSDSDIHILSTPQIMTLDNEEATIKVAQTIPFLTSKNTNTSGNDYSNYEYKDVGVKLNITPQINQERFVRLKISQKVDQVVSINESTGQPTTLTREADTTVVIKDGQTIVIGGLIDENKNNTNYKVPVLGSIPILGYLFRSKTETTDRQNLYIFITPRIVETTDEADKVYENKMGQINTVQEGLIAMTNGTSSKNKDERLCDLGFSYLQLNEYDKAAKYYEKALKANPINPIALLNMGIIYEKKKNNEKAIEMYNKLISLDSDERAYSTLNPTQAGEKASDIAQDRLNNIKEPKK
jgi:general secretion pathway protein D